jgi:hypothetical protein
VTSVYIVLRSQGRWWIDIDGRTHGPFESRDEAMEGVIALITVFDVSEQPQVYAPDQDGHQRRYWPVE